MVNQRHCPFCKAPAAQACAHLALAVEGRQFVQKCIERCEGEKAWEELCANRRRQRRIAGGGSSDREDFIWLETAFCREFLKHLAWFGGLDHEWRTGPKADQGGFWVLLWSRDPERFWWELRDELERQLMPFPTHPEADRGQFRFDYGLDRPR